MYLYIEGESEREQRCYGKGGRGGTLPKTQQAVRRTNSLLALPPDPMSSPPSKPNLSPGTPFPLKLLTWKAMTFILFLFYFFGVEAIQIWDSDG